MIMPNKKIILENARRFGIVNEEKVKKVFCDMDGVIVDWTKGKKTMTHSNIHKVWGDASWWANLEWTSDGKELWAYLKKNYKDLSILSSPGRKSNYKVIEGKKEWLDNNIPDVPGQRLFDTEKANHAKEGYVLIDDKKSNIDEWREEGGIGVLHRNTKDTIKQLEAL